MPQPGQFELADISGMVAPAATAQALLNPYRKSGDTVTLA